MTNGSRCVHTSTLSLLGENPDACVPHHLPEFSHGTESRLSRAVACLTAHCWVLLCLLCLSLIQVSWDPVPNKLLALKYLSEGLLLENTNLTIGEKVPTSGVPRFCVITLHGHSHQEAGCGLGNMD